MAGPEDFESFGWLEALCGRTNPDGSPCFSPREITDFFAAVTLSMGFQPDRLPYYLRHMMTAFAARVGIHDGMTREEAIAQVAAYFRANPLEPTLVFEFRRRFQEAAVELMPDRLARAFVAFAGAGTDVGAAVVRFERPRSEGAMPGGALGFFAAKKKVGAAS